MHDWLCGRAEHEALGAPWAIVASRQQQHLAFGLPRLEVAVSLRSLGQRPCLVDAYLQRAIKNPGEEVAAAPEQLVARGDVVSKRRSRQEERALRVEHLGVEWRHASTGLTEEHQVAARAQRVQALVKGV